MSARQETIDRYRHFRAITKQHLGGALKHLSRTAIKEAAQRLGLWSRGKLVLDSPDEMDLVFDVAVFDTRSGQSRALDRYARAHPAAPGSDEALTLDALQHSRFHIVRVLRRQEIAGLVTEDTVTHEQLWLMDEGLEGTARSGMGLATRLLRVNGFAPGQKPRHGSERNYLWRPTLPSRCLSAMCPMPTNSSRVL